MSARRGDEATKLNRRGNHHRRRPDADEVVATAYCTFQARRLLGLRVARAGVHEPVVREEERALVPLRLRALRELRRLVLVVLAAPNAVIDVDHFAIGVVRIVSHPSGEGAGGRRIRWQVLRLMNKITQLLKKTSQILVFTLFSAEKLTLNLHQAEICGRAHAPEPVPPLRPVGYTAPPPHPHLPP